MPNNCCPKDIFLKVGKCPTKSFKTACDPCCTKTSLTGMSNSGGNPGDGVVNFLEILQNALTDLDIGNDTTLTCDQVAACINVSGDLTGSGTSADPINVIVPFKTCADILACVQTELSYNDDADGTVSFVFKNPNGIMSTIDIDICKALQDGSCSLFSIEGDIDVSVGDDLTDLVISSNSSVAINWNGSAYDLAVTPDGVGSVVTYNAVTGVLTIDGTDYQLIYNITSTDNTVDIDTTTPGVVDLSVETCSGSFNPFYGTTLVGDDIVLYLNGLWDENSDGTPTTGDATVTATGGFTSTVNSGSIVTIPYDASWQTATAPTIRIDYTTTSGCLYRIDLPIENVSIPVELTHEESSDPNTVTPIPGTNIITYNSDGIHTGYVLSDGTVVNTCCVDLCIDIQSTTLDVTQNGDGSIQIEQNCNSKSYEFIRVVEEWDGTIVSWTSTVPDGIILQSSVEFIANGSNQYFGLTEYGFGITGGGLDTAITITPTETWGDIDDNCKILIQYTIEKDLC